MKPWIVEGLKNLISARSTDLSQLNLSWFGGEPLLALKVVLDVARHAKALSLEHQFAFSGGLTTNAYLLTTDVLSELVALNQNFFQITLDGWKEAHDQTRLRADGAGTFDTIWTNLLSAKRTELPFDVQLRIHVTNDNLDSLRRLCVEIHREFGGDNRFRINIQDVRNMGGENGAKVELVAPAHFKLIAAELQSLATTGKADKEKIRASVDTDSTVPRISGESAQSRREYALTDEPYICYASKPNHLLIRANGRIGKCTVALNDDRNDLGFIRPDGTIEVDQDKARRWSKGFETLDLLDLACPISTMHKGDPVSMIPIAVV